MASKYVVEIKFLDRHCKLEKIKLVFDSFEEMHEFLDELKFGKKRSLQPVKEVMKDGWQIRS